jgi:hypothetical protein
MTPSSRSAANCVAKGSREAVGDVPGWVGYARAQGPRLALHELAHRAERGCSPTYTSLGGHVMPEPATSNDHIERANTQFWNPPSLEELMAVAPLEPNEHSTSPA